MNLIKSLEITKLSRAQVRAIGDAFARKNPDIIMKAREEYERAFNEYRIEDKK